MPAAKGRPQLSPTGRAALIGALGVVFGDIGTSPIYTIQTVFSPNDPHPIAATQDSIFGIVSMIFWSVTIVVTVTYVLLVMRADNEGEGGIMALITLIRRRGVPGGLRTKAMLAALGIFGASLFFGDSMITPAISVLSAVEGLEVVDSGLSDLIVPITVVIIVLLFAAQRVGTAAVGRLFGPVMILWFLTIAACGVNGIADNPEILKALSPTYAVDYVAGNFSTAFFAFAAVVLAVTGAEALYADMGHFGRSPITRAWLCLVFPAVILSYMGQGALVLADPAENISSPFFLLVPDWGLMPLVVLATAATVIASQAVITGAFSVAHQAVQLGYLPRLHIRHTSEKTVGQIYVPLVNWVLMVAVLAARRCRSAARRRSRSPSAWRSPARSRSRPCSSSTSPAGSGDWPLWVVLPGAGRAPLHRRPVPGRERDEDRSRRLAAAAHRARDLHRDDHLADGARARHGPARARGGDGLGTVVQELHDNELPVVRVPGHGRLPQRGTRSPRRSRCAPTSSTTTCCTSTSSC